MSKLSKSEMEELREICSMGCEYSGTSEIVSDLVEETLEEIGGTDLRGSDEIGLTDGEDEFTTLQNFIDVFWEKTVDKILNVVETM